VAIGARGALPERRTGASGKNGESSGAGKSSRTRFTRLRRALNERGGLPASFDLIGPGETGGELTGSQHIGLFPTDGRISRAADRIVAMGHKQ
jgi:hypothetical protein